MNGNLFLGALPMLMYPFVMLPILMSLAGHTSGHEPVLLMVVARSFQICSLAYPIVYSACLIAALHAQKKNEAVAAKIAAVPICFFGVICVLLIAWMEVDG